MGAPRTPRAPAQRLDPAVPRVLPGHVITDAMVEMVARVINPVLDYIAPASEVDPGRYASDRALHPEVAIPLGVMLL